MKFCDFRYKVISGLCQSPDAERIVERLLKSCPLIKLILFGPGVDFFVFSQKASQQGLQKSQHTLRTERTPLAHPNTTSQQEITR